MYQNPYFYQPQMQRQEVIRVNGENGARALQLPPNSSALVLDETAPIVWLCSTDGAGYKTVTAYNIQPAQTAATLEQRIERLEKLYESDSSTVKKRRSTDEPKTE